MTGQDSLRGKCDKGHVFVVAYLPMPLNLAAELAKVARCPWCASRKILVADDAEPTTEAPRADGMAAIVMKHTNIAGQ